MFILFKKILILFAISCFWACGSDTESTSTEDEQTETTSAQPQGEVIKSPTTAEGVLVGLRGQELQLDSKSPIMLPEVGDESSVTIFVLRPAETVEGRTSISAHGQARAGLLAKTFAHTGIERIYCEGNAAMQTALMTSRENASELGLVKNEGTDELAKTILKNYRGKRVMVVGSPRMMTDLLNQLSGTADYAVSSEDYDQIYAIIAKGLGDAEIHHLRY